MEDCSWIFTFKKIKITRTWLRFNSFCGDCGCNSPILIFLSLFSRSNFILGDYEECLFYVQYSTGIKIAKNDLLI